MQNMEHRQNPIDSKYLMDVTGMIASWQAMQTYGGGVLVNNPAFGSSSFDGLPCGYRSGTNGIYGSMGSSSYFGSSTASIMSSIE